MIISLINYIIIMLINNTSYFIDCVFDNFNLL